MAIARAGGDIPYDTTKWYMTKFEANVTGKICVAELGDQNYMYGVDGDQSSLSPVAITRTRQYDGDTITNIEFVYYSDYDVTQVIIPQCGQTITETYNCHMVGVFDDHSGHVSNFAQLARAQMRAYFDNYVPGQGVGTVTLDIKPPAQKITFTSLLYGKSITKWIYQDDIVDFNVDETAKKWEILLQAMNSNGDPADAGSLLVNSDFEIITTQTCNAKFDGSLLKQAANSYAVKSDKIIVARYGNCSGINGTWNTYVKDATINDNSPGNVPPTSSAYSIHTKLVIARLSNVTLDFELAVISYTNPSFYREYGILKRNGSFIGYSGGVLTGNYVTIVEDTTTNPWSAKVTIGTFLGVVRIIKDGELISYENPSEEMVMNINSTSCLIFSTPAAGPKKIVIGNMSAYDRDYPERLSGTVVTTSVSKVTTVPRICLVQWHLTENGADGLSTSLSGVGTRNYPALSYGAYSTAAITIPEDDTRSTIDLEAWCEWWWYHGGHVDVYHRWLTLPKGSSYNTNKVEGIFLNQESLQEYVSLQIEAGTYILTGNVWQNEQSYTASQIELRDDDGNVLCQSCRYTNQTTNNLVYTIAEFSTATTIHAYADTSRGSWLSGVEIKAIKIAL